MPTLNDFGPEAYQRAVAQMDALAARLGIQKEIIYQYFNDTAHLPQSIAELEAWGNKPNSNYPAVTPRSPGGGWNVLRPGDTPGTMGAADPGFRHVITNEVDKPQRFQQVDEHGNIFGGSWDPQYNQQHPELAGRPAFDPSQGQTQSNAPAVQRSASSGAFGDPENYVGQEGGGWIAVVGGRRIGPFLSKEEAERAYNANSGPAPAGATPPATTPPGPSTPAGAPGTPATPAATAPGATTGTGSGLGGLIDAAAYGNTQTLQASIDDAIRRYALARTDAERNQAYLDLQRYKTELDKVQNQQKSVTDLATSILSAATSLGSRPADYVKFNEVTSGGRDIFDQISGKGGPAAAYGGPTGQVQAGSVWDLLGRLGVSYPQTPATPTGSQPGAPNPSLPGLPQVPVPGANGVPGALQPGAGGAAPGASPTALPSLGEMLKGLDTAAGGSWTGNRADPNAVSDAWWNASPERRGKPRPAFAA